MTYFCLTCGARSPTCGLRALCMAEGCVMRGKLYYLTVRGWVRATTVRALGVA